MRRVQNRLLIAKMRAVPANLSRTKPDIDICILEWKWAECAKSYHWSVTSVFKSKQKIVASEHRYSTKLKHPLKTIAIIIMHWDRMLQLKMNFMTYHIPSTFKSGSRNHSRQDGFNIFLRSVIDFRREMWRNNR